MISDVEPRELDWAREVNCGVVINMVTTTVSNDQGVDV